MKNELSCKKYLISEYAIAKRNNEVLSTREYAKKHGGSKSQISKYESGYYDDKVSSSVAKSFCRIYDVSHDEFIANFEYNDNPKIIRDLGVKAQIETRLTNELSDTFSGDVCMNFYRQNKDKYKLNNYKKIDYLKPLDIETNSICIERQFECNNERNEKIIISYFLRPFLFTKKPRSTSYRYIGKAIADVSCYDSSELFDCKNFIFITPSRDVFNFYSSKKYNKSSNNLYIVHVTGNDIFDEPNLLFGKKFIG